MRFKIAWRTGKFDREYKVNVPNYDGGAVVTLDEVEELEKLYEEASRDLDTQNRQIIAANEKWQYYEREYILPLIEIFGWKADEHAGETVVDEVRRLKQSAEHNDKAILAVLASRDELSQAIHHADLVIEYFDDKPLEIINVRALDLEDKLKAAKERILKMKRTWQGLMEMVYGAQIPTQHCNNAIAMALPISTRAGEPEACFGAAGCTCTCAGCCYAKVNNEV